MCQYLSLRVEFMVLLYVNIHLQNTTMNTYCNLYIQFIIYSYKNLYDICLNSTLCIYEKRYQNKFDNFNISVLHSIKITDFKLIKDITLCMSKEWDNPLTIIN